MDLRPCQILGQAAITLLGEAPQLLDHAKGVLAARACTRTRPIDQPPALTQPAAGSRMSIDAIAYALTTRGTRDRPLSNTPDRRTPRAPRRAKAPAAAVSAGGRHEASTV